jgi:hypothetical protein
MCRLSATHRFPAQTPGQPGEERKQFFFEKKAEARPAGTKKLLFLRCTSETEHQKIKVFCFFSSEKKCFLTS